MAKFITGAELEKAIYDIIWEAKNTLLIVSPFIKLDDYFKKLFDKHLNNPKLHIVIVFGKNETEVSKSLSAEDFDYFKQFMNISVIYVPKLHAKYYGNEKKGVVTSINLHNYSFKNNIEFGVYSEINVLNNITNSLTSSTDQEAWNTCHQIANENEAVFIKRPVYDKKLLSAIIGKNYVKSDIIHDTTTKFYNSWGHNSSNVEIKRLPDFPSEIKLGSQSIGRPSRDEVETKTQRHEPINTSSIDPKRTQSDWGKMQNTTINKDEISNNLGYCIRSGERIPYNPNRPMSENAYRIWAQYGNVDFQENFCHKTGRQSNGRTSMRNPIL